MTVADIFSIRGRGLVATGQVESGSLSVGDEVLVNGARAARVDAIEAFRKQRESASAGDNIGVLLRSLERSDINPGDVLTAEGSSTVESQTVFPDVGLS